jgi:hypothetical protein
MMMTSQRTLQYLGTAMEKIRMRIRHRKEAVLDS